MGRLLIIDGHAYAYRAFHAIRELRSPTGAPTNAIYGFIKMVSKMRDTLKPSHVIVVWDGGLNAERMTLLPEYKAQRPEMPGDLAAQLDEITNYLQAAGLASFCEDGVEADDYIACLVQQAAGTDCEVVIASSDKDFMQLVSARVGLLNPNDKTEAIWAATHVQAKSGVLPEQIVDWLSLVGDSVDNIPGVPGIGVKTAADLLRTFGSIKDLYERLAEVKSERLRTALQAAAQIVQRNQELVRLRPDLKCEFSAEKLIPGPINVTRLSDLFRHWGFKSMLAGLEASRSQQEALF